MEKSVTFKAGDVTLEGLLSLPQPAPGVGVVVCHPHPLRGGEMHNNVVTTLVQAFQAAGHATLRFNFRGVGASTGTHDDGNAEQSDVKAAVTELLSHHAFTTVAIAGYSFGSLVGLKAGADDPRVAKLIGVALPLATRDASFLQAVTKPKLLISGDRDNFSPVDALHSLLAAAAPPKKLHIVPGADHFFGGHEAQAASAATAFLAT
ncbi:MAG: alpha/beta fold hydrolase [Hyphomicrobiaceae bacterium]